jgi:NAD+ synthase
MSATALTVALAQVNPTVGDVAGNADLIRRIRATPAAREADLVVFPELVTVGYPPEDLVLRPSLQQAAEDAVHGLARDTADGGPALLVTSPWREGARLFNAALLLDRGRIEAIRFKHELPNYGVFDEKRVFAAGPLQAPVEFRGTRLGVMVCEDMWFHAAAGHLAGQGAEVFIVPNGSPFETGKSNVRLDHAQARVAEFRLPLVYVNQVGGQDELVFDGASFVLDASGDTVAALPGFIEHVALVRFTRTDRGLVPEPGERAPTPDRLASIYQAMMLGLRDYVNKNRFPGIVLGLSGGIDSAISAAVAVDALGADRVRCVMMPSRYTTRESLDDAADCARRLGVRLDSISIAPAVAALEQTLAPMFEGRKPDITEENLQSRLRGVVLMALSNKFGPMVLTTGNKSEMSVGYATLYGDMCGGYSVLKDVYKVVVYELSRWRNAHLPAGALTTALDVVPANVIEKAPTAELRPNQKDQDSLPEYEQLDAILEGLVEEELPVRDVIASGQPEDVVRRIQHLLYLAEYKRRQAPPGVKITRRNFGRDRRYPITNRFRG